MEVPYFIIQKMQILLDIQKEQFALLVMQFLSKIFNYLQLKFLATRQIINYSAIIFLKEDEGKERLTCTKSKEKLMKAKKIKKMKCLK